MTGTFEIRIGIKKESEEKGEGKRDTNQALDAEEIADEPVSRRVTDDLHDVVHGKAQLVSGCSGQDKTRQKEKNGPQRRGIGEKGGGEETVAFVVVDGTHEDIGREHLFFRLLLHDVFGLRVSPREEGEKGGERSKGGTNIERRGRE